jgi:hypothetical protein
MLVFKDMGQYPFMGCRMFLTTGMREAGEFLKTRTLDDSGDYTKWLFQVFVYRS